MNHLAIIEQQFRDLVKSDPVEEDLLEFVKDKVTESYRDGLEATRGKRSFRGSKVGFSSKK